MRLLSLAELGSRTEHFDALAFASAGIDGYCSSTRWALPALEAFSPVATPRVVELEHGYAAFHRVSYPEIGAVDMPFDSAWGLGCPLIVSDVRAGIAEFRAWLGSDPTWSGVVVSGLDPDSVLFRDFRLFLAPHFGLGRTSETRRSLASLQGGMDGFLSRRTRKFRANLRRAEARAAQRGVRIARYRLADAAAVDAIYPRILEIEATSWKSLCGEGVDSEPMRTFVHRVLSRAARCGDDVRVLVAELDGAPIGYLHGALCEGAFRGLQMSYDARVSDLSLGNLLQAEMVRWLTEDDAAHTYDLGSELEYKRAWGERTFTTWTVLIARR